MDLFNDPLLPEQEEERPKKKKGRSGSFDNSPGKDKLDDEEYEDDEGEGVTYDDLTKEEKIEVLRQLYEQY